jgi:hypothetical protein
VTGALLAGLALACGRTGALPAPDLPDASVAFDVAPAPPPARTCPRARRCPGAWSEASLALADTIGTEGNAAAVAVGADCIVHVASADGDVRHARLEGATWIEELVEAGSGRSPQVALALDAAGEPQLAWGAPGGLRHARRIEGQWRIEVLATTAPQRQTVALALDATGAAHLAFTTAEGVGYASNAGGGWRGPHPVAPRAIGPSIAVNAAGTVFLAYGLEGGGVELTRRDQAGLSVHRLAPDAADHTAIALGVAGEPHVIFMGREQIVDAQPGRQGGPPILRGVPLPAVRPAAAIDGHGALHVAAGRVTYATEASGAWTTKIIAHGADAPALALDADGVAHLVFSKFYFGGPGIPRGGGAPIYYATNGADCP